MNSSDKKKLPVLILVAKASKQKVEEIDVAMIGGNVYHTTKRAQRFAMLIKHI